MPTQYSALYGLLDGVIVVNGHNIVFVNEVMENLLGSSQTVVSKETLEQRFGHDNPLSPLVDYVIAGGHRVLNQSIAMGVFRALETGQNKHVIVNVIPLSLAKNTVDNQLVMILIDHRSIMGRSFMGEDTVQQDHQNQSLTHVVNMVAHEIKNPLAGIRGAAQLLADGKVEEDPMLSLIVRETDRIARLIERLEVLDDVPDGAWEYCNVHAILSDVIASARAGFASHIDIIENYDPSLPDIWCNRDQMIQVFMNLIKNASEACPHTDGRVEIKTYYNHSSRGSRGNGGNWGTVGRAPIAIDIIDNGGGVPDTIAEKVFDPFVKGKQDGTGLGLAVVSKFVANHNGKVDFMNINNDQNKGGAVFMVKLPHVKEVSS